MKKWWFVLLCFPLFVQAQNMVETEDSIQVAGLTLHGTLAMPAKVQGKLPLMIIISGSGPTDRNCNSSYGLKSDAFKKLATYMAEHQVATFRYDKRGVGESVSKDLSEENSRFEDMVHDCKAIISKFEKDDRFNRWIVAGHSEGSLVGMLSVDEKCRYVSISGLADDAAETLKKQVKGQFSVQQEQKIFNMLDSLKQGQMVHNEDKQLMMLFRPSVLPYLISWFKYKPSDIFSKLKIPTMVISGMNDIQVEAEEGRKLHAANKESKLLLVEHMNHVLVETNATAKMDNIKTYNQPELPLSETFLKGLLQFCLQP